MRVAIRHEPKSTRRRVMIQEVGDLIPNFRRTPDRALDALLDLNPLLGSVDELKVQVFFLVAKALDLNRGERQRRC